MALSAAPALAEPDYTGTLDAATTSFTWDGSGSGVTDPFGEFITCEESDVHQCDDVLLKLDAPGDLTVDIANSGGVEVPDATGEFGGNLAQVQDLDMYVYASDASGEPQGESLTEDGATTYVSENATVKNLQPGYYLVRVEYFLAAEAEYVGTATLAPKTQPVVDVVDPAPVTAAPAPAPAVAPATTAPAQPAQPARKTSARKKALAKCRKKAKRIKKAKKRKAALKRCAAKAKRR